MVGRDDLAPAPLVHLVPAGVHRQDLRAARDAPLVSETSLFAPKLNTLIAAETVRPGSGNRELPRLIHQLRSQYHRGLLSWIRDQDPKVALGTMRHVLDMLNSAAGTARLRRVRNQFRKCARDVLRQIVISCDKHSL